MGSELWSSAEFLKMEMNGNETSNGLDTKRG